MDSTRRAIRFQNLDSKKSIIVFWLVVLAANIFFYIMNFYSDNMYAGISNGINGIRQLSVAGSNMMSIIVYFIVYSYLMYYESFPIAIGFSVTRKDFFKSLIVNNILVSFIFAIIQGILLKLDPIFVRMIDREPLLDFMLFHTTKDNLIFIIFSLFFFFLVVVSATNLLGALNYRFGYKIWIILGAMLVFGVTFKMIKSIVFFLNELIIFRINAFQVLILSVVISICYALGYFLTINTNIKNKIA
ncbi:hypothetical protein SAMN05660462_00934 [Proteiniborus ethanoligenes]|uniref:ABC-2 family transporter protein n=1 Tax=Proteiniborus ethanoligenes TaxID=415015 RepID=A0A1H3MVT7_9FIRM|nr:hypothetical protein [Proteiniborus ethanoligenes]TAH62796.1 MAG: hypothetical protein EWM50_04900 [Gottschalkiaceae bacterium]SDY80570.1 hypothetical protein SAMN05660462_00934 [Proteiniborus ethanoligenes]